MDEPVETSTELSVKDMGRLKIAIQGLSTGKTYTQIKDEIGISRPTLYALMRKQGSQELLKAEVVEIASEIRQIIQELLDSGSKVDKRFALQELSKIHKQFNDKVTPNLSQSTTLNLNANIDLTKHLNREHIHTEVISRMPPTMRQLYTQLYTQVQQEYQ